MRIAINASYRLSAGSALHLRRVLNAWCADRLDQSHEITVFSRPEGVAALQLPANSHIRFHILELGGPGSKLVWEQTRLPGLLSDGRFDVLFCPGNISPFKNHVPSVVIFHHIGPFSDSATLARLGPAEFMHLFLLRRLMCSSARSATRVIFVSRYFQTSFEKQFDYFSGKSDIIYHGRDNFDGAEADNREVLRELKIQDPYILSVGHLQPYKNFPELIHGYHLARHVLQQKGLRLIIAGKPAVASYVAKLRGLIAAHGLESWVLIPGDIQHAKIRSLLGSCDFSVFQSTCEACPLGLIEALSVGAPIASSNASAMPEIAGDAALYFDPYSPEDISRAMIRMAQDQSLKSQLRAAGPQEVLKFPTWSQVGRLTIQSLERAAGTRHGIE